MEANDYESRRLAKIKQNQALLAELDIKPVFAKARSNAAADGKPPPAKRRRLTQENAPTRTSARVAAAPVKPSYNEDVNIKAVALPRSAVKKGGKTKAKQELGSQVVDETGLLVPVKDVESIKAGWTAWEMSGEIPTRDATGTIHFQDYPEFTPNKEPAEMLREGCFGGSYYRPLRSRKLGLIVEGDWEDLPKEWIEGLDVERYLISPSYDPDVNKYKVACGQSIEEFVTLCL